MNRVAILGFALDLCGVLLLGIDLARVQRQLRRDAEERLSSARSVCRFGSPISGWH